MFGTLTRDGKQLFRQYDIFNQDTFLDYLKQIKKHLGKVIMFTDRARQHQSNKVQEYLHANKKHIRLVYLPKGSPDECCRIMLETGKVRSIGIKILSWIC